MSNCSNCQKPKALLNSAICNGCGMPFPLPPKVKTQLVGTLWPERPPQPDATAENFLLRLASLKNHVVVSSGEMTTLAIAQAQADKRFFVLGEGPGFGLGFALMPRQPA